MIFFIMANVYFLKSIDLASRIKRPNKVLLVNFIVLLLTLCFSGEYAASFLSLGEHKKYYELCAQRLEYLKNANKNLPEIILDKFDVAPFPVASVNGISSKCDYYTNIHMAQYFNINGCIRLESGSDGDNSKTNIMLKKWRTFLATGLQKYIKSLWHFNKDKKKE